MTRVNVVIRETLEDDALTADQVSRVTRVNVDTTASLAKLAFKETQESEAIQVSEGK